MVWIAPAIDHGSGSLNELLELIEHSRAQGPTLYPSTTLHHTVRSTTSVSYRRSCSCHAGGLKLSPC